VATSTPSQVVDPHLSKRPWLTDPQNLVIYGEPFYHWLSETAPETITVFAKPPSGSVRRQVLGTNPLAEGAHLGTNSP
jgi:hypothetical protein